MPLTRLLVPRTRAGRIVAGVYLALVLAATAGVVWGDLHYTGMGANLGFVGPILLTLPSSAVLFSVTSPSGAVHALGWSDDTAHLVGDLLFLAEIGLCACLNVVLPTLICRFGERLTR